MSERALDQARRDAALARERLLGSAHELQARLSPHALADDARDAAREKGEALLDGAARRVSEQPVAASAAAAGLLAFLLRRPILRLFRRRPAAVDHD